MTKGLVMFLMLTVMVMTACTAGFDELRPSKTKTPHWRIQ